MKLFGKAGSILWRKLGNCRSCTMKAFWSATGAWALYFFVIESFRNVTMFVALGLTVLWLSHVVVFALKARAVEAAASDEVDLLRRRGMLLLIRLISTALVASTIPASAFAMGSCGSCGSSGWRYPECMRANYDGTNGCTMCRSCGNHCGDEPC